MLTRKKLSLIFYNKKQSNLNIVINYKNTDFLKKFINVEGKILPKFITKLSTKDQKKIAKSIKFSRIMGLMKFVNN